MVLTGFAEGGRSTVKQKMMKWCSNNEPMSTRIHMESQEWQKCLQSLYLYCHPCQPSASWVNTEDLWSELLFLIYREVTKLYSTILNGVKPKYCSFVTPEPPYKRDLTPDVCSERCSGTMTFLGGGEVLAGDPVLGQRHVEGRGSNPVRVCRQGFCTDGFFLWVDGVYFLYRRCDFMHAGLRVLCFGFGVCWVLTFAAAMLFSSSAVTWLVGCVGIPSLGAKLSAGHVLGKY